MGELSTIPLGDICAFKAGDAFKKDFQGRPTGAYPFIKVSDMNLNGNARKITRATNWVSASDVKSNRYTLHDPGSVVFAKIGVALTYNRRRILSLPTVIDNNMMAAKPNHDHVDAPYLYYLLSTIDFNEISSGSSLPYLTQRDLERIQVNILPKKEQATIALLLGSIDDKIDLNQATNETLEATARALFKDWFVDFGPTQAKMEGRDAYLAPDLWQLFPDRLNKESGIPEGWESEPVYDQAEWVNGAAYKNMHFSEDHGALPVVKIAELKAGITNNTKFTNTELGEKYRIYSGELLFSWSGNPDTSIDTFIWQYGSAWLNQHIFAVRSNGKMSKALLYILLKSYMPEFAEIARNKQTTGLGHVTKADMKRMMVCVASDTTRNKFEELVHSLFDTLVANLYENRWLVQTRDLLLPKLMSGEIRLRDAEKVAGEVL